MSVRMQPAYLVTADLFSATQQGHDRLNNQYPHEGSRFPITSQGSDTYVSLCEMQIPHCRSAVGWITCVGASKVNSLVSCVGPRALVICREDESFHQVEISCSHSAFDFVNYS